MGVIVPFSSNVNSQIANKLLTNYTCLAPSQYGKLDVVLLGETFIAYEMFQNLTLMHIADGRCFWQNLFTTYGCHPDISHRWQLSNYFQKVRFGYTLNTANALLNCEVRHILLMNYFKTLSRCIKQKGCACDSTYEECMDIASVFLSGRTLNLLRTKSDLGYPLSTANGMLHCNVKHPLPME